VTEPNTKQKTTKNKKRLKKKPVKRKNLPPLPFPEGEEAWTMRKAETKVMKQAAELVWNQDIDIRLVVQYLQYNCLHQGNYKEAKGMRYMLGMDGSAPARRGLQRILSVFRKDRDHLLLVTIRSLGVVSSIASGNSRGAVDTVCQLRLRYELWNAARNILRPIMKELKQQGLDYTALIPEAHNSRELLCTLAFNFNIDLLVLGARSKEPKSLVTCNKLLLGKDARYCLDSAQCSVMIVK